MFIVPAPIASNCNFDGGLLCGFVQQPVGDDFDWEVGSYPVEPLGLSGDHTGGGSYVYFNTTGKATSQTAILRTMQLASPTPHCLTFYFYMAGTDVGSLVVLQNGVGEQRRTELWSIEGDQGQEWKRAKVDVTPPLNGFRINFDAVVGSGQLGLIAIDDVVFVSGLCDSDGCNVPLGMESGWITDNKITASPADPGFPPSAARLHGNGSWIPVNPQSSWLQVEFTNTMILTGIRTQGFRAGWITKYKIEYSETLSSVWIMYRAFLTTDQLTGNVDADTVVEHLFSGRIQAQRIKITPLQFHIRPSLRLEIIGCGGSFLLADATGTNVTDTAILSSEVLPPTPAKCYEFYYHMDSPEIGALNVYLKRADMPLVEAVAMTPAWRLVGQQGHGWRRGGVEFTADFPYEVVFQAVMGDGGVFGYGDIGLDDVLVREGLCPWPEFDDCLSSPCLNNGTCTDGKNNYTCTCGEQFYGPNCENDVDDCKSAPCLNDGTCIDGDRNYTCICSEAFYGGDCEFVVQCPPLTAPLNGALRPVGETSYQDLVTFTCNQGYELNGASNVTCQADQTWSQPVPACTPVQCQNLTAPEHGALSSAGPNYYPDVVTFTCNQGYELSGASSVTCQADQTWSDPIPTCTFAVCILGENLVLTNSVTEGFIISPYYPGNYPNNINCSWTITAPSAIQLDFVDTFDIEHGPTCQYDYVRVFEGQVSVSSVLGTFCGTTPPMTVRTVSNVMSVQFQTDYSRQYTGFRAKYSIAIQCSPLTAPANGALTSNGTNYYPDEVTFTCDQGYELIGASSVTCQADQTWSDDVPTCAPCVHGESLALTNSVTEGYIVSPNYPYNYTNNADCSWTITSTAHTPSAIQLNFETFDIERDHSCRFDYVKVFEGRMSPSSVLGTFCGVTIPPTVRTVGNVMAVQFRTDSDGQRAGFKAKYSVALPCNPTPMAPINGTLSPDGANYYQGDVITFTCNQGYELVGASIVMCQSDQTWTRPFPRCTPIECHALTGLANGALSSTGATSYQDVVTFTCNQGYELNGASSVTCQANHAWSDPVPTCEPCLHGENLVLTNSISEGFFTSPNYPGDYPDNIDCSWTITAPSAIQLDFVETFDIEPGPNCTYDYVRVFEGEMSASSVLGTFCGTDLPPTLRTVGNVMTVKLHTDYNVPHSGFRANHSDNGNCLDCNAAGNHRHGTDHRVHNNGTGNNAPGNNNTGHNATGNNCHDNDHRAHNNDAGHNATGDNCHDNDYRAHNNGGGNNATGHNATGNNATGNNDTGHNATGHNATGNNATGDNCHDNDHRAHNNGTGNNATGDKCYDNDNRAHNNNDAGHNATGDNCYDNDYRAHNNGTGNNATGDNCHDKDHRAHNNDAGHNATGDNCYYNDHRAHNNGTGNNATGDNCYDNDHRAHNNGTGNNATGDNATRHNTTGHNSTGHNATGDNATGDNATGDNYHQDNDHKIHNNATGNNTTGNNATGNNATGNNATGNNFHDHDYRAHNNDDGNNATGDNCHDNDYRAHNNGAGNNATGDNYHQDNDHGAHNNGAHNNATGDNCRDNGCRTHNNGVGNYATGNNCHGNDHRTVKNGAGNNSHNTNDRINDNQT
ncbi:CSMD3 [Branchiostoma lanceolatum]|uniref:CSMD3 protein n=1 Tax=Branchiostoma lanceolatum TaxID=7740 RepID=A0A8J9ZIM1_BRALA|nr:CSMD3 [Branchiostoma lanceolatum]